MKRTSAVGALLVFGLCSFSSPGCHPARTEVVVVLATDLPLTDPGTGQALSHVRVRAGSGWDPTNDVILGTSTTDLSFDLGAGSAQIMLPASFTLLQSQSGTTVTLIDNSNPDGSDPPGTVRLRRVLRTSYMQSFTGQVTVWLNHACMNLVTGTSALPCPNGLSTCTVSQWCEAQQLTCGNDGCCRSPDLGTADFGMLTDGAVPTVPDAGAACSTIPTADSGVDAAMDAPTDTGQDAAVNDSGSPMDAGTTPDTAVDVVTDTHS